MQKIQFMQSALADFVGIHPDVFHWVIVPILIFLARICDVSIGTLRMMFLMSGRRQTATLLGFFESLIWLIAISQILQNVTHPISYIAYAAGFATGIFVGMMIEERLAVALSRLLKVDPSGVVTLNWILVAISCGISNPIFNLCVRPAFTVSLSFFVRRASIL